MSEYIFDPPEIGLREFLLTELPAFTVADVVVTAPEVLPARFVQVESAGGQEGIVTQHPIVSFTCWGSSRADSARLASTVSAVLKTCRSIGGVPVYSVRTVGGPVYRQDPDTRRHRYQVTVGFSIRGRDLTPA